MRNIQVRLIRTKNEVVLVLNVRILVLLIYLFVKVPRPGDSEVTFSVCESNHHLL